jgi:hypothetical protein
MTLKLDLRSHASRNTPRRTRRRSSDAYANPRQLRFSAAVATSDAGTIKLIFELRVGGYNGSTYTLNYDPASDRLKGVFHQAVAKQDFEVIFVRSKS